MKSSTLLRKTLIIVSFVVIAASAALSALAYTGIIGGGSEPPSEPEDTSYLLVKASEQTEVTRPEGFPDPEENWIKLPESENLALGKHVESGEATEVYVASNALDGELTSYWESKGLPAEFIIDLAGVYSISTVAVRLNPAPIWEPRNQTFEVLVSTDGVSYTTVAPEQRHDFDPETGNIVRVDFDSIQAQFVKFLFTAKSSGRSNGAQAAEICVYE